MQKICVVHLVRARNGLLPFRNFLDSYSLHRAGLEHELVLVFKGFRRAAAVEDYLIEARRLQPKHFLMSDFGFDLRAYSLACQLFPHKVFCFLNSFSELLADDWLRKLFAGLETPGVGVAGATGSSESMYTNVLIQRQLMVRPALVSEFWTPIRLLLCRFFFQPFPNPHLRTNGIIITREMIVKIWPRFVMTKRGAYLFENGKNSLTRRVQRHGRRPVLVGRDGRIFEIENWGTSNTFRQGKQENLLVADNQTRQYDRAEDGEKKYLTEVAWGKDHTQASNHC
jgi:hypothetical protein